MKLSSILTATVLCLGATCFQAALAQAVFGSGETSPAQAAAALLAGSSDPVDADVWEENGLEDGSDAEVWDDVPSNPMFALDPKRFNSESGPIRVLNCSPNAFTVKSYNSDDTVYWVPYEEKRVAVGESVGVRCATSTCSLKINNHGPYTSRSGSQVWAEGDFHTTNTMFTSLGCSAFGTN